MLKDTFKDRSNDALRKGDAETRRIMGNILSKFLEAEKAPNFPGWTPQLEVDTIRAYIGALKKGMEPMPDGPVKQSYQREIDVLSPYLPAMLDEDATRALVMPLASQAKSLGQLIGLVMKTHKGQVAPDLVRKIGLELGLK